MRRFFPPPTAILGIPDRIHPPTPTQTSNTNISFSLPSSQDRNCDASPRWIRLLRLHPMSAEGQISCTTFVVQLPDTDDLSDITQAFQTVEPFEALSYAWGDASAPAEIILNGEPALIRRNLYQALKALRYPDYDRVLWADALCIQQENVREKSQQIPLMGAIFRAASKVVIWLGPASTRSGDAIVHARETSGGGIDLRTEFFRSFMQEERRWNHHGPGDARAMRAKRFNRQARGHVLDDLLDLAARSYWQRGWVVQEFLVAKRYDILWSDKRLTDEDFEEIFNKCILLSRSTPGAFAYSCREHDLVRNRELRQSRLAMLIYLRHQYNNEDQSNKEPSGSQRCIFWKVLSVLVDAKCYDVRDRVYSLIGFMPKAAHLPVLDVDYSRNTLNLFWDVLVLVPVTDIVGNARTLRRALGLSWTTIFRSKATVGKHLTGVKSIRLLFKRTSFAAAGFSYSSEGTTIMTGFGRNFEPCDHYNQAQLAFDALGNVSPSKKFKETCRITSSAVISRERNHVFTSIDGTVLLFVHVGPKDRKDVVAIGSQRYVEEPKAFDGRTVEKAGRLKDRMFEPSFIAGLAVRLDHEARHAVLDLTPEQFLSICMQH